MIEAIDILANERAEKSDASGWMRKENHTKIFLFASKKKNVGGGGGGCLFKESKRRSLYIKIELKHIQELKY